MTFQSATITIEALLSGDTDWTDITADVMEDYSVINDFGLPGAKLKDRVGKRGTLSFVLDNSEYNSGSLAGYYSPASSNLRAGFVLGIPVRIHYSWAGGAMDKYQPVGYISKIEPTIGLFDDRITRITAKDYMGLLGDFKAIKQIALQTDVKTDEAITTLFGAMPRSPNTTSLAVGLETLPYVFDLAKEEKPNGRREISKLMMSTLGYAFIDGDTDFGETFITQTRQTRTQDTTVQATLSDIFIRGKAPVSDDRVYDEFRAKTFPRAVSTDNEVAFTLQEPITLNAGQSKTILAPYRDPTGGAQVSMLNIVTDTDLNLTETDYDMGSGEGDGSTDLTADLTVAVVAGAIESELTLTNGGVSTGYINRLQLRGQMIRHYDAFVESVSSTDARETARTLQVDFPYLSDVNVGRDLITVIRNNYSTDILPVSEVTFWANGDSDLMDVALSVGIGKRINISESQTGVSQDMFIQSKRIQRDEGGIIKCTLRLERQIGVAGFILDTDKLDTGELGF